MAEQYTFGPEATNQIAEVVRRVLSDYRNAGGARARWFGVGRRAGEGDEDGDGGGLSPTFCNCLDCIDCGPVQCDGQEAPRFYEYSRFGRLILRYQGDCTWASPVLDLPNLEFPPKHEKGKIELEVGSAEVTLTMIIMPEDDEQYVAFVYRAERSKWAFLCKNRMELDLSQAADNHKTARKWTTACVICIGPPMRGICAPCVSFGIVNECNLFEDPAPEYYDIPLSGVDIPDCPNLDGIHRVKHQSGCIWQSEEPVGECEGIFTLTVFECEARLVFSYEGSEDIVWYSVGPWDALCGNSLILWSPVEDAA